MLVDQQNEEFLSLGNIADKSSLVMRGPTSLQSVANHVLNNELVFSYPPVRLAHLNASMLNRGLNVSSSLNISNRQQVWHLSFLFNAEVDLPKDFLEEKLKSGMEYRPNSFLAQLVLGSDKQYLAVIQLVQKQEVPKFSEQDVMNLQIVSEQLGQVLSQVNNTDFLNSVSFSHF